MNMLPPMNENSYCDHVKAVRTAAESVALESMSKAATEVNEFYKEKKDGLYNIGVSGDGTWRKRGCSSSYGVVTVISTVTGKAVDCEVRSVDSANCGEERKEWLHLKTGGKAISMIARQILLACLDLWMRQG